MAAIDQIIFHQILAWHHFYDWSTPAIGIMSDGFLHAAELLAIAAGGFLFADLRGHMAQHLLIGMFAPLGLVLAAPVTLALRTLPVKAARRLATLLRSRPARWVGHPVTALALNSGGMFLLYLTPLYAATLARAPSREAPSVLASQLASRGRGQNRGARTLLR
jgi:hypothetical protein